MSAIGLKMSLVVEESHRIPHKQKNFAAEKAATIFPMSVVLKN